MAVSLKMFRTAALMALRDIPVLVLGIPTSSEAFSRGVSMSSFSFSFEEYQLVVPGRLSISQEGLAFTISFETSFVVETVVSSVSSCRSSSISSPHTLVLSAQQVNVFRGLRHGHMIDIGQPAVLYSIVRGCGR